MNEIEVEGVSSIGKNTRARAIMLKHTRIGNIPSPLRFLTGTDLNRATRVVGIESNFANNVSVPFTSQAYGIRRAYDKDKLDAIARGKSVFDAEFESIIKGANRKDKVLTTLLAHIDPKIAITDSHDDMLMMLQAPLDFVSVFDSRHIGYQELEERIAEI